MPHPLPEDIDNVSGLKWFLAAVPDDPAFTRAAWDVFTELANYWKWGMEGPVPEDSDKAAQLWSNAVYATIEAYQMGFPDVLLGYIDEIEDLLQSLQFVSCCATTSVTGDTVTSDITPDVGDPPATWGDDETVADWEDWRQLVCGAADEWVTHLKSQVDDIETYLDAGLLLIGVVTALLTAGAGAGILIAIKYSVAVEAFAAILANANNIVFQDIQNGLEGARADIRCAIFDGCEDLETVIESAVGTIAWGAWYQFYDWCSIRNSLLEGQFNGGFHAVNRSELCACVETFDVDVTFTFDTTTEGWGFSSRCSLVSGQAQHNPKSGLSPNPTSMSCGRDDLAAKAGVPEAAWALQYLEFDANENPSFPGWQRDRTLEVVLFYDDATSDILTPLAINTDGTHVMGGFDNGKAIRTTAGGSVFLAIRVYHNGNALDGFVLVDNVRVAVNAI